VHVAGHSWGAVCALEAARLTRYIARMVLYDPSVISTRSPDVPFPLPDELDALIAQDRRDEALALFYQRILRMSPEVLEQSRVDPAWAARKAAAHTIPREMRAIEFSYRFDWNTASEIDRPTLFLQGEFTLPVMRASMAALHATLPTSQVAVLQGQGHGGLRTAPKQVADEILKFVQSDVD
jgi:pimeloyl-ACP methyl ester carboxylesterase